MLRKPFVEKNSECGILVHLSPKPVAIVDAAACTWAREKTRKTVSHAMADLSFLYQWIEYGYEDCVAC